MQTEIKQRPILFSTPMVQAILDGRKTMTRRIIKSKHESGLFQASTAQYEPNFPGYYHEKSIQSLDWDERTVDGGDVLCPYGNIGDILWVREEHYRYGHWEEVEGAYTPTGKQKWCFVAETDEVKYSDNPPEEFRGGMHNADPETSMWYKRLARFMPKEVCRLFLRIKDIRVERLYDISEEDAIAEGAPDEVPVYGLHPLKPKSKPKWYAGTMAVSHKEGFKHLWESINGPDNWKANPWVWVVSFERIDKPE